jgi:hypothetical protein
MQFRRWDSVGSVELTFPPTEAPDPALWIQFGLSLANLSTNCTVPAGTAGRPERPRGYPLCQPPVRQVLQPNQ